ncbi:MAG: GNAT family N-acetyltransferase [Chloroflexota bacterium]|nr:GNAT family N-acetyltransferase [Chloroflexota bacterium]
MVVEPITLEGRYARLEPLRMLHADELYTASRDPNIWTWKLVRQPQTLADTQALLATALRSQADGAAVPFAIISRAHGRAMGETRYLTIMPQDRGLEIGWTWLAPEIQRTGVNTECKYLLLRHAFEDIGAIRVQLKTHHNNVRSQRAIERLGAVREGTLRNHMIMPDGSYRHSVYYSIIADEWTAVKARLEGLMARSQESRP